MPRPISCRGKTSVMVLCPFSLYQHQKFFSSSVIVNIKRTLQCQINVNANVPYINIKSSFLHQSLQLKYQHGPVEASKNHSHQNFLDLLVNINRNSKKQNGTFLHLTSSTPINIAAV